MNRIFSLLLLSIIVETSVNAQATAGKIAYQKTEQPVAIIELPCDQDVTELTIKDYMKQVLDAIKAKK